MVLGREVVRGPTNNAGDAGHIVVDPRGPVCRCGRRGCLGDAISPERIVRSAISGGVIRDPGRDLDLVFIDEAFSRVASLAYDGDEKALALLEDVARTSPRRS